VGSQRDATPEIGRFRAAIHIFRILTYGGNDPGGNGPPAQINEVFTNVNVSPTIPSEPGDIVAGGLAGFVQGATIRDINCVGPVHGRGAAGGVVGRVNNDYYGSIPVELAEVVSRGSVTASGSNPAGPVGSMIGTAARCIAYYDLSTDPGTPAPTGDVLCNAGFGSLELKAPYQDAQNPADWRKRDVGIFYKGQQVTQALINIGMYEQCRLSSGSDGDWGFGTCLDTEPRAWSLNTNTQYNTLWRIPNGNVQPK
jgi:hypothetical protein